MLSPENIHTRDSICTEHIQFICVCVYRYMYAITISKKKRPCIWKRKGRGKWYGLETPLSREMEKKIIKAFILWFLSYNEGQLVWGEQETEETAKMRDRPSTIDKWGPTIHRGALCLGTQSQATQTHHSGRRMFYFKYMSENCVQWDKVKIMEWECRQVGYFSGRRWWWLVSVFSFFFFSLLFFFSLMEIKDDANQTKSPRKC